MSAEGGGRRSGDIVTENKSFIRNHMGLRVKISSSSYVNGMVHYPVNLLRALSINGG